MFNMNFTASQQGLVFVRRII